MNRNRATRGIHLPADIPPPGDAESPPLHLSRRSFGLALAITLAIFFLLHPLWRPLDMAAMDRNILWSYAPIPLLVLGLLALERKLRWSSWLLETIRLTFVKFAITFLFANLLWTVIAPPGQAAKESAQHAQTAPSAGSTGRFQVQQPPPPSPIDVSRTGRVAGVVLDAARAPQGGVLVALTGGLEGLVFAPRPEGVVLTHDGSGLSPRSAVLLVYEPLILRSATDGLHSIRALDEHGRQLLNTPLRPGSDQTLMFDRALGRVRFDCTVHGQAETGADLAIVANPFAARTGTDGRFVFEGVPAGRLELTAWGRSGASTELTVSLEPGRAAEDLELTVR